MKISIDGKEIFGLTELQKKVIMNEISSDVFYEDMCRRLKWVLMHKYEQCFKRLKEEWDKKLIDNDVLMVPTNPDEYAYTVFSQNNYQDAKKRGSLNYIDNSGDIK